MLGEDGLLILMHRQIHPAGVLPRLTERGQEPQECYPWQMLGYIVGRLERVVHVLQEEG